MRTDLRHSLNEGINLLLTWRNRYSKFDYPEKVVLNIFYRKYTMEFMFPEIVGCFENTILGEPKVKWMEFNEGFKNLKSIYEKTAISRTQAVLINLLSEVERDVGNTNYGIFAPLIASAQKGDIAKLEEIEYAYLYYLLTDECVLLWGALGGTGLSKIEAIGKLSGVILEVEEIKTYPPIEQILGRFCAAAYLKEHYKSLPPNVQ